MQGEILLVNPRRGKGGRFVKSKKRRRRKNPVAAFAANPRRRRRKAHRTHARRRRVTGYAVGSAPIRRRKMNPRRRRNPRFALGGFSTHKILSAIMPAAIGGAGALALDVAMANIPLPAALQSGYAKTAVRIAGAFGLGIIAGFIKRDLSKPVTAGALTVVAYQTIKELAQKFAPTLPGLSDYTDYQVGYVDPAPALQAYMEPRGGVAGMGAYMQDAHAMGNYGDGM